MTVSSVSRAGLALRELTLLYVEDDARIREQLGQYLRRRVGVVHLAADGVDGLEAFRRHHPDIVVSDIRMPRMDGLEMVAVMRRVRPTVPVIMTTAYNEADYLLRAIDLGVDRYVIKPVQVELLDAALERCARDLRSEQQHVLAVTVFESAAEAIVICDGEWRIVAANPAFSAMTGFEAQEATGRDLASIESEGGAPFPRGTVSAGSSWRGEWRVCCKGGRVIPVQVSVTRVDDVAGQVSCFVLLFMDLSERERRELEILALNRELRQARDGLEARVLERTRELVQARDAAEQANLAKSRFLSQMSHELRTPMNAILGFAELLQIDGRAGREDRQHAYATQISTAGQHLLSLIDEVLDLAKVEVGKLSVSLEATRLAEVVEDALMLAKPLAPRLELTLAIDCPDIERFVVIADRIRLKQVLLNLLSNAIKYNRPHGSVRLGCEVHGETLRITVSDTGRGIRAEDLPRLFRPFERIAADAGFEEGAGIGLALSKQLAELMGGRIGVTSVHGVGSTFWVEVQLLEAAPRTSVAGQPAFPGFGRDVLDKLAGRRVLYVEDNPANLEFMVALFRKLRDVELATAGSAEAGLALMSRHRPDIVVMDIGLPGMSGIEAVRAMRQDPVLRSVPVVALSADAMLDEVRRGLEAGFDAYLTKPIQVERLVDTLVDQLTRCH